MLQFCGVANRIALLRMSGRLAARSTVLRTSAGAVVAAGAVSFSTAGLVSGIGVLGFR